MSRLTKKCGDYGYTVPGLNSVVKDNAEIIGKMINKLAEYENLGTVEGFKDYKTNSLSKIELYKGGDAERDLSNELKAVAEKLEQLEKDSIAINKINNAVKQNLSKELEVYKRALKLAIIYAECNCDFRMPSEEYFLEEARKELEDERK